MAPATSTSIYKSISAFLEGNIEAVLFFGAIALIAITVWVTKVNEMRSDWKGFVKEIREDIKKILLRMGPEPATSPGSPIELTKLGNEIAEEIKAVEIVDAILEKSTLFRVTGDNAFDIQTYCFNYAADSLLQDNNFTEAIREKWENMIKESAFRHGLNTDQITKVIGVMLRDRVLRKKGIDLPD